MFAPGLIQGRWLGAEDFEALQRLIAEHPDWSRRRLSIALCEALNWRTASGQLKDMSARLLLNKLAERGFIKLPPRQRGGGRRILRALSEPELFSLSAGAEELIECPLRALQPLEVIAVEPRTAQANAFICHLAQHHYLGFEGVAGQNLRYLLRDCYGRDLACVLFAGAAWKVKARDAFIGWSAEQRQERLSLIINNSRFLILPHVRVPHLASHILGTILRRLRSDWQRKYYIAPCLAETFVERERFAGVCYRAANWLRVGQTCGRSRHDRDHTIQVPVKDIYLYPLCNHFKERLCA
jgi:Druantia protein DruA